MPGSVLRGSRTLGQLGQRAAGAEPPCPPSGLAPRCDLSSGHGIEADEVLRRVEPELHVDQQIRPARHDLGIRAVLGQRRQPLGQRLRSQVLEFR